MKKENGLRCPECGAQLNLPEGLTACYCQNCRARLLIDYGTAFIKPKVMVTGKGTGEGAAENGEEKPDREETRTTEERFLRLGGILLFALFLIVIVVLFVVLNRF